jgi:iron complex outermembrane receptor protein
LNGSYSKNYVSQGKTYLNYYNESNASDEIIEIDLTENEIGGFPSVTINSILRFYYDKFSLQLMAKYVGKYYSDNYADKLSKLLDEYPGIIDYSDNTVDAYFTSNVIASYEFPLMPVFKKVRLFAQVNNIFDNLYAAHAIGKEYFPATERNYLVGLTIGL